MNIKSLWRHLKAEAAANPGKAVALGVLLLVAAYFWLPPLVKYFLAKNVESSPGSAGAMADPAPPVSGSPFPRVRTEPEREVGGNLPATQSPKYAEQPQWNELLTRIGLDPRMKPRFDLPGRSNPFAFGDLTGAPSSEGSASTSLSSAEFPESLPWELRAIVMGPECKFAIIGSNTYAIGPGFPPANLELEYRGEKLMFTLTEVYPDRVVLVCRGRRYELHLPAKQVNGRVARVVRESAGQRDPAEVRSEPSSQKSPPLGSQSRTVDFEEEPSVGTL